MTETGGSSVEIEPKPTGRAAVYIASTALALCALLILGFLGAIYLWLGEKARITVQAEDHATQMEMLGESIRTARQELEELRIDQANQQSMLAIEIKQQRQRLEVLREGRNKPGPVYSRSQPNVQVVPLAGFPQPTKTGEWTGRLHLDQDGFDRYVMPFQGLRAIEPYAKHGGVHDWSCIRTPTAFSRDGSKLFIVDGQSILRRFDSNTLKEEAKLILGAGCFDIQLTSAGLALSLPSRNRIWIIDPQTLSVTGEVEMELPTYLAATPTSEHVYAIGFMQLNAIEAETLQLQTIATFNQRGNLERAENYLSNRVQNFAMYPLGGHLFTYSGSNISQFTINKDGIEYVQSVRAVSTGNHSPMVISRDGTMVAVAGPMYGPGNHPRLRVRDANNSKNIKLVIKADARLSACAFDVAGSKIVAAGENGKFYAFSHSGELEESFYLPGDNFVYTIAAFPMGERYLLWSKKGMWVEDLRQDRLSGAIPSQYHQEPEGGNKQHVESRRH